MIKHIITVLFVFCFLIGYGQQIEIDENSANFKEIISKYNEAETFRNSEEYQRAITLYEEIIHKFKTIYGTEHEYYALFKNNLGELYYATGQNEIALTLYKNALETVKRSLGEEHYFYGTCLYNLAEVYKVTAEYNKAIHFFSEALTITKKTLGKEHESYRFILQNLAELYVITHQYDKAVTYYNDFLEVVNKSLGKTNAYYRGALKDLAEVYKRTGQYEKGIPLLLEALKITETNLGKQHPDYGTILNNIAVLYQATGQYEKGIPLLVEALKNTEINLGKQHPYYATNLNNLASFYKSLYQYDKALPLCLEALKITEETLGKAHYQYGIIASSLSDVYDNLGQYDKAIALITIALQTTEKTIGRQHPTYSAYLNNLASLFMKLGQNNNALPLFIDALHITEQRLGKRNLEYITQLRNLALAYQNLSKYDQALPLLIEALQISEAHFGKEHPEYGASFNDLAGLYQVIGQYNKAKTLLLESLEITENNQGKNHTFYSTCLNNLAGLYVSMREYKKALPYYIEALEIIEKNLGKTHFSYNVILANLIDVYIHVGELDKALSLSLELLEEIETNLGKNHPSYISRLVQLATLKSLYGNHESALTLLYDALKIIEMEFGKENSQYGNILLNIADLHQVLNNYVKAIDYYEDYQAIINKNLKNNFAFLTGNEKQKFIDNIVEKDFQTFHSLNYLTAGKYPEALKKATNNTLLSKGLLLNASKNILNELKTLSKDSLNQKIASFRTLKATFNKQLQLPIEQRVDNFNQLKEELNRLERELVTTYSKEFGEDINYLKDFRGTNITQNEIAIEFTNFRLYNKSWTDSIMYAAYLYKKGWESPKMITLFEEKQLKQYVATASTPQNIYQTRGGVIKDKQEFISDSIYNLVWKPLEPYLKDAKQVYFSPDGLLHKLSFAALPDKNNNLLVEKFNLNQMGNTADIRKNTKAPDLDDVLLIGGIDYSYNISSQKDVALNEDYTFNILQSKQLLGNEENKKRSGNGGSWKYLKGTQKEVQFIQTLLPKSDILDGKKATESAFKALSGNSPSVLHIATHGYFFPDLKKEKPTMAFEEDQLLSYDENPLLRSGLIMANANYAWKHGHNPYEEDDGILTALEISNLDLSDTDIVILSACETGLGDIPSSEGVYGLQRAFKMAGVETIIMTLWEIPDKETAEFMNLFYTQWKATNKPKQAFKTTQLQMAKKYRTEPEKWAGFVYFE
jgi:tetratricopeptide (TPR) repeat protein